MQMLKHADAQTCSETLQAVNGLCGLAVCMYKLYDIQLGMLQVRENEISLRNLAGGTAHLRTLEGILATCHKTARNS